MNGHLVLVADDDPAIVALLHHRLSRAGYRTVLALDGREALARAGEAEPDLLLLDVEMPGLDGYAVFEALRRSATEPPPVIFLTARAEQRELVRGLDAGAADYIVKPFRAPELMARVAAALRTKERIDGLIAAVGIDHLTSVGTRAAFDARLEHFFGHFRQTGKPLSCVMLDLDHLKEINDRHGHTTGDAVLQEAAVRLQAAARADDEVFRYGGDEFAVLLPGTRIDGANVAARRLREVIALRPIDIPLVDGVTQLPVRASAGAAEARANHMTGAALVTAADKMLYTAKRAGRSGPAAAH